MNTQSWDIRFLGLAKFISSWSKDPSTKVGAVITDKDNRIISLGYNGFPNGVEDDKRLSDRETKYKIIVHAEANAILFSNTKLNGCTLYTYPFQPCSRCAGLIIQSGITKIVAPQNNIARWESDFAFSKKLLEEANISIKYYDML
jgi:dCMP deaminase